MISENRSDQRSLTSGNLFFLPLPPLSEDEAVGHPSMTRSILEFKACSEDLGPPTPPLENENKENDPSFQ